MNRPDEDLLAKYFDNLLDARKAGEVLDWLSTAEGQRYLDKELEKDFSSLDRAHKLLLKPRLTAEDILRAAEPSRSQPIMNPKPRPMQQWRIAASIIFMVCLMGALAYFLSGWNNYEEYHTAYAESAEVALPDGSTVHMSGNSHLRFRPNWKADEPREIWFEGEGYFTIQKKAAANRFTVHTDRNFEVQVLGTTFTVTARPSTSRVVLETGSIALNVAGSAGNDQIMMKPGELVEMDLQHDLLIKKEVAPEHYTSRRNDELVFSKTPLKEIIRILKDDYGFTVIVNNEEILEEKFTGVVPSKNVETLLEGLSSLLDVEIVREKNIIKLIQ